MNDATDLKNELGRPVIKFIVLFGIVLVIKFIVLLLPMVAEITINKEAMPLAESINILFSTVLLAIWINFGFEIARTFDKTLPKIPEAGYMAKAFVFLVTFVAAYQVYMPLAKRHLNEKLWIYQLAFIVVAVFPIAAIARTLYQNVDNITNFILDKAQAGHGVIKYICTRCGAPAPWNADFCSKCGGKVSSLAEITRPGAETRLLEHQDDDDEKARHCPTCGRPVTPEASFCKACGTQLVKKVHEI